MQVERSVFAYASCQSFEMVNTEVTVTQCGIAEGALGLQIPHQHSSSWLLLSCFS